jgi:hypothetical protein
LKKRLSAVVVGAGVAGLLWLGGPNAQACDTGSSNGSSADQTTVANPATGGDVYGAQTSDAGGYAGTSGSTGYIEAGGDATSGGYVQGRESGDRVYGRVDVSQSPGVCVNDQP